MRRSALLFTIGLVAATALSGCRSDPPGATSGTNHALTLPSGTSVEITLATSLSSETAQVGNAWTGSTRNALMLEGRDVVPVGSSVAGTVTSVKPARKGERAMLDLGLATITVDGRNYKVRGGMESIVAGSTRARNLGAIAGSAAGGALIGKAVSGTGKGALIGGIVGGGVATGAVAASDGYQVRLKPGTSLTFTTNEAVAVRP